MASARHRRLAAVASALAPPRAGGCSSRSPLPTEPAPDWAFETWEQNIPPPPPTGWCSRYVIANGIRLHYWRTPGGQRRDGQPKPVIVLAHGYADCGLSWWYAMRGLTDDFELIALDARGHGLSDPPDATTPADAQAEDIAAVIKELGLVKPIVMGHSMGAAATMWFAARYPNVPRAVVLEDPGLSLARPERQPPTEPPAQRTADEVLKAEKELQGYIDEILIKNNMTFGELMANQRAGIEGTWGDEHPPGGVDEMLERWAQGGYQFIAKMQHHPNNPAWLLSTFPHLSRQRKRPGPKQPAASELFDSITAPTLILKADDQGEARERNLAVCAHLSHPHGGIVHVRGSGHNVRRDQTERMLDALLPFLNGV